MYFLKMIGSTVVLYLALTGMVVANPEPAREPWSTTDDYFKVVERGFLLDSMPHHVHFIEKGKIIFSRMVLGISLDY